MQPEPSKVPERHASQRRHSSVRADASTFLCRRLGGCGAAAGLGAEVAQVIGSHVRKTISNPALQWSNTCPVRMRCLLNPSGTMIPDIPSQTGP
uniref:Uncharacterized protein n=1 Tax=Ralstonia solanacearum TaxID=305 RepID=A0A0S4TPN2_RALSL|nr:protein of unknown function [Ralstonia solanacearum]